MAEQIDVFYGYPSTPPFVGESIENATNKLLASSVVAQDRVNFRLWPEIRTSGKVLAREIMKSIDEADVFACDLTYPNANVSFELGYAIGRLKRVFISLDSGIADSKHRFSRHYFSTFNLGYASYTNYQELAECILRERPWRDVEVKILDERYRQEREPSETPHLLYLVPPISTSSVLQTVETIRTSKFNKSYILDDPRENPSAHLDWYAEQLVVADAVMIHLLGEEHIQKETHNTKASFIAGLACGLNRKVLMLGHSPYESPVDYDHLFRIHDTAESCAQNVDEWLNEVAEGIVLRQSPKRSQKRPQSNWNLRDVSLGQHVAEHERNDLGNYFVGTGPYYAALQGPTTILIGRRGTGKTAILYAIKARLERDTRNHVTILNPAGYELEGLIRVLQEAKQFSERGFLIESLWKYLIYSEIALSVQESLSARSINHVPSEDEAEFMKFCKSNAEMIAAPFSTRLGNVVRSLVGLSEEGSALDQRIKISERLHETLIRDLRLHLGAVLSNRRQLAILIDNLDGPWEPGAHVPQLAELIRGLLNVVENIPRDLRRSSHGLEAVDTMVTVLLRSDIFSFVRPLMPEQDKLPIEQVVWDDKDLLRRVLDQRLMQNAPKGIDARDVWEQLFPERVEGKPTVDFILDTILPRPRDVIYMVKTAISAANNRHHISILPEDLSFARDQYSKFAFGSVLAEDDPQKLSLEAILFEFAGASKTVSLPEIREMILKAEVEENDVEWYVNLLCDIGFLGVSTSNGFRYSVEEGERSRLRQIARRLAERSGHTEVYEINPAFYQELQIN